VNNENTLKYIISGVLVVTLLFFTVLIIKPIFLSIVLGLILSYIFYPFYRLILSKIKNETISAFISCLFILILVSLFIWFSIPILINQIFDTYVQLQNFNIVGTLKNIFPALFTNEQVASNLHAMYTTFLSSSTTSLMNNLNRVIMNFPTLILEFLIVLLVFFYGLRDGDKIINLIKDSLPFDKTTTTRFINKSQKVTFSVVFGRVIIGIITGALSGVGFYLVGAPNSLLLMYLAMITSILPMIGPWIVWGPVVFGFFMTGQTTQALFLTIYSLVVVTLFENLAHPFYVSKQSDIPNSLTLIGIIGGILAFGIFGIILGPLIIAYLIILFEIYKEKNMKKE